MADTGSTERTMLDWLVDAVNFPVSEGAARDILSARGIAADLSFSESTPRERDLARADLYVWMCTSPTRRGDTSDSDNSWSHKEGGFTLSAEDKDRLMGMANAIYAQYDEEPILKSGVKLHSFGIRKGKRCRLL